MTTFFQFCSYLIGKPSGRGGEGGEKLTEKKTIKNVEKVCSLSNEMHVLLENVNFTRRFEGSSPHLPLFAIKSVGHGSRARVGHESGKRSAGIKFSYSGFPLCPQL